MTRKQKDHDSILKQLEEKTEKMQEMNQKIMEQDNDLRVLTMEVEAFEERFEDLNLLSNEKDQEVTSLRMQEQSKELLST